MPSADRWSESSSDRKWRSANSASRAKTTMSTWAITTECVSAQADIGRAFPAQIALLGGGREDFERNDDIAGFPPIRIASSRPLRDDEDVGLWQADIGNPHANAGACLPRSLALPLNSSDEKGQIPKNRLMQSTGRAVQERLPVNQLPLLIVRPRVGEGEVFLHRHWAGLDCRDAHRTRS